MALRLVVWNCAMALHSKYERLLSLRPDIAVIPECAEPDVLRQKAPDFNFQDCEWNGTQKNKGLGVFAFGGSQLRLHQSWRPEFHIFLPIEVRGQATFNLLAVWAFNQRSPERVAPNPANTARAIAHYDQFLEGTAGVVAGDFNASVFWDKSGRYENFAKLDRALSDRGLVSVYHAAGGHALGNEPAPTLFWQKKISQGYHIDYAYIPRAWMPSVREAWIGAAAEWLSYSDHAPLVMEVETL